ncbi:unnamed protein product [Caenorhabditis bovis]|uniref:Uncharacterized protein n=1 Tax=Caenorhabditis bovis TaxID=2654633 RepID=A0A8S1F0S8_9PELO|nr:unnamed protein product [Caenorhabditis bovis]
MKSHKTLAAAMTRKGVRFPTILGVSALPPAALKMTALLYSKKFSQAYWNSFFFKPQPSTSSSHYDKTLHENLNLVTKRLKLKILELQEANRSVSFTLDQLIELHHYRQEELDERLESISTKIFAEERMTPNRVDQFVDVMNDIEIFELLLDACRAKYREQRNAYLYKLADEDIMKSNMERIVEIGDKIPECCKKRKPTEITEALNELSNQLEAIASRIEHDFSTCRSISP